MNFKIDKKIFENNHGLMVGVLVLKDIDNKRSNNEIPVILRDEENIIRKKFSSEEVNQHPHIQAWRNAHKRFGNDPKRYMPSVWALAKRVIKGGEIPEINKIVDLYNFISLKYIMPVGGEELDKCSGDIELAYAIGGENFTEIGGNENNPPETNEIIYKDNLGVLCRKFNWRESERTKITKDTRNAVLVIEILPPFDRDILEKSMNELKTLILKYCGGNLTSFILDVYDASVSF